MIPVKQAVILVGGKGTRLGALALDTPKPLLEISEGFVFLDILLDNLSRQGFISILLLAGHMSQVVVERYQDKNIGPAQVKVIIEKEPMGTAGALAGAQIFLDDTFLMMNGDSLFEINLRDFIKVTHKDNTIAALALMERKDAARYGTVKIENGLVRAFLEKQPSDGTTSSIVSGGIYLLSKKLLDYVKKLPCSIETDIFPLLSKEKKLSGEIFSGYFLDIGLPATLNQARNELTDYLRRPAVFFDRDGVLNEDKGYTHRPEELNWNIGAIEAIHYLNNTGYRVIVVTNQAGVAKGHYSEEKIIIFHNYMQEELFKHGAYVDQFYYCPYHPDGIIKEYKKEHPDRKPNPGMILSALNDWQINKEKSFLIGDRQSDILAAENAGIKGYLHDGGNLLKTTKDCIKLTDAALNLHDD